MPAPLNKHFTIAEAAQPLPEGWREAESGGWWIGRGEDLRLYPLHRPDGTAAGVVLGWVAGEEGLMPDGAPLAGPADGEDLADWSADLAGRFVCLVHQGGETCFMLDAGGLLGAVYDPARRAIASIPRLLPGEIARDEALVASFGVPERHGWYPFGLTPARAVSRLMPDFALDLRDFTTRRIWPLGPGAIPDRDPAEAVPEIHAMTAGNARRLCGSDKVAAHLTAGHDSRMVLAALGPEVARMPFVTISMPNPGAALDVRIAGRLAARLGLRHEVRPYLPATAADVAEWRERTGDCISDAVSGLSRTLASWDADEMQLTGACGEVARAYYWGPADLAAPPPDADELLRRIGAPLTPATHAAADAWRATLPAMSPAMSTVRIWDLVYIEQRLGCWAGPAVYGSPQHVPSMSPFNTRRLYAAMLGLPDEYRVDSRFCLDFNAVGWPAVNELPFNTPVGLDRFRFVKSQVKALLPAPVRRRIKRLLR